MAKKTSILTAQSVAAIRPGETLWDGQVTGLGIRAGAKRAVWHVKVPVAKDGRNWTHKCETLGDVSAFTLESARVRAKIVMGRILEKYGNPDRERIERETNTLTLETAWKAYVQRCRIKGRSARTIEEYEFMLARHFGDWKAKPMAELGSDRGRTDFKKRFNTITRQKGPAAGNGAVRAFSAVWNYTRKESTSLPECPSKVLDGLNKLEPRKVAYTPEEVPAAVDAIWKLDNIRAGLHFALFLTGVRGGGLRTALRRDYDRKARTLLIRNHKGKPFLLPLSNALVSLFDCMVAFGEESFPNNEYLFPAHSAEGYVVDPRADLPPPAALVALREKLGKNPDADVKTHLWRNTYITLTEEVVGIPEADCRRLVDHSTGKRDPHTGYKTTLLPRLLARQEEASRGLLKIAGLGDEYIFTHADFLEHRKAEVGERRIAKAKADPEMAGLV